MKIEQILRFSSRRPPSSSVACRYILRRISNTTPGSIELDLQRVRRRRLQHLGRRFFAQRLNRIRSQSRLREFDTLTLRSGARLQAGSVSPKNAPLSPIARRTSRSAFGWRWAPARSSDVAGAAGDVVAHFGSVAIGTPSALWAARYAEAVPFGISTADPPTIAATGRNVDRRCGAGRLPPARRVVGVDPMAALRHRVNYRIHNQSEGLPIQLSFSLIARPHSIRKLRVQPS